MTTSGYTPEYLTALLCSDAQQFLNLLENNLHDEDFRTWLNHQGHQTTYFSPGLHILYMLVGTLVRPEERTFGYGVSIEQSLGIKIAEKLFALGPNLSLVDGYEETLQSLIENTPGSYTERSNNNMFTEFMLQHL